MRSWKKSNPGLVAKMGRRYAKKHKEQLNAKSLAWRQKNQDKARRVAGEWRSRNLAAARASSRAYQIDLRNRFLALYGGACACCGERCRSMLHIDHVHNDGGVRRKNGEQAVALMRRVLRIGKRVTAYQILCGSCNWSKQILGGVCEHALRDFAREALSA